MNVSTRIIAGFGTLLLVAISAVAYEISVINEMRAVNRRLTQVHFSAAATIGTMQWQANDLEDYARKDYALGGDPVYANEMADIRRDFSAALTSLPSRTTTPSERDAIQALSQSWNTFWRAQTVERARMQAVDNAERDMPPVVRNALDDLRRCLDAAGAATQASIQQQTSAAAAAAERAATIAFLAAIVTLLTGIGVALLGVRAITAPLKRLKDGTRRISRGQFSHRLPATGTDEFSEVARDFNSMAQRLAELDTLKKDFVSHVSHDLKAPLASIRQTLLVLLQGAAGPLSDPQRRLLEVSGRSAARLAAMVSNLLDMSSMEAGTMEYDIQPIELTGLVRETMEEFEIQARGKSVSLNLEATEPVWAAGDRNRLRQVIGNLLENALKFSPSGRAIQIGVELSAAGRARVSVSDRGPGVPDEHKTRIFEKFHQVRQGAKMSGQGIGLGLAICRTIVVAHQGDIWVDDVPNGGSRFSFSLPAAIPDRLSPPDDEVLVEKES